MIDSAYLKVAKEAALEAGKIIKRYFGKKQKIFQKGDSSNFATQTDLAAEKSIINIISKSFPDHKIIGEETGESKKHSDYTWIIDPIDGTVGFEASVPFFVVSIGLLKKSELILGVIYWVVQDKLYFAQKGKGAYLNERKIQVSKVDELSDSVLGLDLGHLRSRERKYEKYFRPLMYKIRYPYAIASVALIMALVGEGALDGYCGDANIWDFAGAAIIVEEAGGRVSDLENNPIDWTRKRIEIAVSNNLLHKQIVEVVK